MCVEVPEDAIQDELRQVPRADVQEIPGEVHVVIIIVVVVLVVVVVEVVVLVLLVHHDV